MITLNNRYPLSACLRSNESLLISGVDLQIFMCKHFVPIKLIQDDSMNHFCAEFYSFPSVKVIETRILIVLKVLHIMSSHVKSCLGINYLHILSCHFGDLDEWQYQE